MNLDFVRRAVEALESIAKSMEPTPGMAVLKAENERLHQKLGLVGTELEKERNERKAVEAQFVAYKASADRWKKALEDWRNAKPMQDDAIRMDGEDMMETHDGNVVPAPEAGRG